MDLMPVFYWLVIAAFFIVLMRMRVLSCRPHNGPRRHRSTYRK